MIARIPVKLPGPQPTAKKEISLKDIELSFKKDLIVGTIISDNSLLKGIDMLLKIVSSFNKVSDKSDVLVSIDMIMKSLFNNKKKVVLYLYTI